MGGLAVSENPKRDKKGRKKGGDITYFTFLDF
jgi:hypothetical protein